MLAAKFFDDQYFNNAFYAKVRACGCVEVQPARAVPGPDSEAGAYVGVCELADGRRGVRARRRTSGCACSQTDVGVCVLADGRRGVRARRLTSGCASSQTDVGVCELAD
jgi:hypothetical protein